MYRIGIGYDQHRFIESKKLMIGGVEIPFEKGLEAHSDGDVLLHAICDSLLGALGRGDIGEWFPDTDDQFMDMDSALFVRQIMKMVKRDGYEISNCDCIVIADEPKLGDYKSTIKAEIASLLGTSTERVNVKATRTEGLGGLSDGKGIAAKSIILLRQKNN